MIIPKPHPRGANGKPIFPSCTGSSLPSPVSSCESFEERLTQQRNPPLSWPLSWAHTRRSSRRSIFVMSFLTSGIFSPSLASLSVRRVVPRLPPSCKTAPYRHLHWRPSLFFFPCQLLSSLWPSYLSTCPTVPSPDGGRGISARGGLPFHDNGHALLVFLIRPSSLHDGCKTGITSHHLCRSSMRPPLHPCSLRVFVQFPLAAFHFCPVCIMQRGMQLRVLIVLPVRINANVLPPRPSPSKSGRFANTLNGKSHGRG